MFFAHQCPAARLVGRIMERRDPLSRRGRRLLQISFLTTFAESMLVPMYAAFTERVGGSILDAGIAFAVFSAATGLVVILVGTRPWYQWHVRTLLMAGFMVSALCDLSYLLIGNRWQLFAAQVAAGLATGLIEPAWDTLFTEDIAQAPARHWSIWAGGTHLVAGIAAVTGGLIVSFGSFAGLFVAMATMDTLATLVAWRADWKSPTSVQDGGGGVASPRP